MSQLGHEGVGEDGVNNCWVDKCFSNKMLADQSVLLKIRNARQHQCR